jgi:hypothetical protein
LASFDYGGRIEAGADGLGVGLHVVDRESVEIGIGRVAGAYGVGVVVDGFDFVDFGG